MLNRHAITTRQLLRQNALATVADSERGANEHIRSLLKAFGLRTSLVRLKVLDALLAASDQGQPVGVRGIHSRLLRLDVPLSFLSVREVLKRLSDEGVVVLGADKTYSLHPTALQWLHSESGQPVQ